ELLGFNDDPATRDLLLKLLATDPNNDVMKNALAAARKLWPEDSLEPDYALLQNPKLGYGEDVKRCTERVCERGEPKCTFEGMTKCTDALHVTLGNSLLARDPLPVAEARQALGGTEPRTVRLAAQILGRAGKAAAGAATEVATALKLWRETWEEQRRKMLREA